ncbi:MAG: prolyl oligopeptidase [Acidimicrobiaceae bacterium]
MPPLPVVPARIDDVVDVLHGVEVHDPYRWLEDGASLETRAWADAQNTRTRAALDAVPSRARLHGRLSQLLRAGTSSAPHIAGGRVFSLDRWGEREQSVLCVRGLDTRPLDPQVVLDPAALLDDDTAALDWYQPSVDGRLVAYGVSGSGDERSTLRILHVESGRHVGDEIPHTRAASIGWWPDGTGFHYTRYATGGDYDRHVFSHRIGDDWHDDVVLFDALPDPTAWPDVSTSRDGRYALVHVGLGWSRTDVHLLDLVNGERTTLIEGRDVATWFGFDLERGRLVGHTNEGAARGRVISAPLGSGSDAASWTTLVPESDAVIDGVAIAATSLLVATSHRAVSALSRHAPDGRPLGAIELPELGSLAGLAIDHDTDDEVAVLALTSFTRPSTLFRWSPTDGVTPLSDLPGGPDPSAFAVEQVDYPSTDGTAIPMFVVRPAGVAAGAARPTILNGYGGFSVTNSPAYSAMGTTWVEDGGAWAVACIRGGAEEGEAWHQAGMREHKQQVFDDFHAAGDWLVAEGRTTRDLLAVRGGSNGGLLMGAAITQRPDLCRAVVCAVPLLDMVRYHRFLIARLWIPEYGDPDVAEEFAWLYAYSPYHHVVDGTCYPAVLIETGEEDSRVDPLHARKFAARLQAATSCGDEHPALVRIEAKAGHGQGKPASRPADEAADVQAFLHWQLAHD